MQKQKIELSTQEVEDLKALVESIQEQVQETEKRLAKLKESLEFLNLVLKNILQSKE